MPSDHSDKVFLHSGLWKLCEEPSQMVDSYNLSIEQPSKQLGHQNISRQLFTLALSPDLTPEGLTEESP